MDPLFLPFLHPTVVRADEVMQWPRATTYVHAVCMHTGDESVSTWMSSSCTTELFGALKYVSLSKDRRTLLYRKREEKRAYTDGGPHTSTYLVNIQISI